MLKGTQRLQNPSAPSNASLVSLHAFLSDNLVLPASIRGTSAPSVPSGPSSAFLQTFLKDRLEELVASESRGLSASATLSEVLDVRVEAHRRGVMEAALYQKLLQTSPAPELFQKQSPSYIPPQDHPWFYEVIDRASELVEHQKAQQATLEPLFKTWLASASSAFQKLVPHVTAFLENVLTLHVYTGKLPSVEHLHSIINLLESRPPSLTPTTASEEKALSPQVEAAVQRYQTRLEVERFLEIFKDNAPMSSLVSGALPLQESRNFETILAQANNDLQRFQDAARQREQALGR